MKKGKVNAQVNYWMQPFKRKKKTKKKRILENYDGQEQKRRKSLFVLMLSRDSNAK